MPVFNLCMPRAVKALLAKYPPETLRPGDVVTSKCTWNNPTDHGVGYGPTADDEMCFSYVMYFPKIETDSWHWSLPALYSTCR